MLSKDDIKKFKKEVTDLNKELESKASVNLNELLSHLYRKGIIKGLENKDLRNGRVENIEKRIIKLHGQFKGFTVKRDDLNDQYIDQNIKEDTMLIGEILALEYVSGLYQTRYAFLANAPFPVYLGWYGKSALVHMKATPTASDTESEISLDTERIPSNLLGKLTDFDINGESIDPSLTDTLLLYFAEGAIPRDYDLKPVKSLINLITEDIKQKYSKEEIAV